MAIATEAAFRTSKKEAVNMMFARREKKKAGDTAADPAVEFDEVYRRYIKPVYAFVAYGVGGRAAAEDVTSQVFEKAWRGYGGYDPGRASLATWLFTIARNCVTDHLRRSGRAPESTELSEEIQTHPADSGFGSDPLPRLEAQELRLELRAALDSLDIRERDVVALKFGGSLNNREIAGLLDLSESNVGTILYRSLRKMKTHLEGGIKND